MTRWNRRSGAFFGGVLGYLVQVGIKRSQCLCTHVPVSEIVDVFAVSVVCFVNGWVRHDADARRRDPSRQPAKEAELVLVTEVAGVVPGGGQRVAVKDVVAG